MTDKLKVSGFLLRLALVLLWAAGPLAAAACDGKDGAKDGEDVDTADTPDELDVMETDIDEGADEAPACLGDFESCGTDCYRACDCSREKVGTALEAAPAGGTVEVPAGSCTWTANLTITKGLTLAGTGMGSTFIRSNYHATNPGNTFAEGNFLVVYSPASPEADEPFRLTGFTFDFASNCGGILLQNSSSSALTAVRVDHNEILNASFPEGSARAMMTGGAVYGVIDNNFIAGGSASIDAYGSNEGSWDGLTFTYGSADCMYYEDNTFNITDTPHAGGAGGRYCARYNTYVHDNPDAGLYPWYDMHGNMGEGGNYSTMGVEIYGNLVTMVNGNGVGMFDQRGGKALIFGNRADTTGSVSAKAREENDDALNPTSSPQPQHVSDSYYWNNRKGAELVIATEEEDCCDAIAENQEFFNQQEPFDGTAGIGCGTLASRPAACMAGTGYWATDQDCSSVPAGSVGAHPAAPIAGTLYTCTAPDTWTEYFVPYAYPHPLRGE